MTASPFPRPRQRRLSLFFALLFLTGGLGLLAANLALLLRHARAIYLATDPRAPRAPVAIVLGTSPKLREGGPNPHFLGRIEAAAALYQTGRVTTFLLSGARHSDAYDEPREMKAALLARGLPESALLLDPYGFRTLDSIVRARRTYGFETLAIVSQRYHAARALEIARHEGIEAVALCAADLPLPTRFSTELRELLARAYVFLDLQVFRTAPATLKREAASTTSP